MRTIKVIELDEWNKLVKETYGKPYNFQQQDGCIGRGFYPLSVPNQENDFQDKEIPEIVNHEVMGVPFKKWLKTNPEETLVNEAKVFPWKRSLWWERNFYPSVHAVANDLHSKGLLEAGEYLIEVDWRNMLAW